MPAREMVTKDVLVMFGAIVRQDYMISVIDSDGYVWAMWSHPEPDAVSDSTVGWMLPVTGEWLVDEIVIEAVQAGMRIRVPVRIHVRPGDSVCLRLDAACEGAGAVVEYVRDD